MTYLGRIATPPDRDFWHVTMIVNQITLEEVPVDLDIHRDDLPWLLELHQDSFRLDWEIGHPMTPRKTTAWGAEHSATPRKTTAAPPPLPPSIAASRGRPRPPGARPVPSDVLRAAMDGIRTALPESFSEPAIRHAALATIRATWPLISTHTRHQVTAELEEHAALIGWREDGNVWRTAIQHIRRTTLPTPGDDDD